MLATWFRGYAILLFLTEETMLNHIKHFVYQMMEFELSLEQKQTKLKPIHAAMLTKAKFKSFKKETT